MLTKHLSKPCHLVAYRPHPKPHWALPTLVAFAAGALAAAGGLSPLAVAGLTLAGGLAGLSASLTLWAHTWCHLTEQGWVVE